MDGYGTKFESWQIKVVDLNIRVRITKVLSGDSDSFFLQGTRNELKIFHFR